MATESSTASANADAVSTAAAEDAEINVTAEIGLWWFQVKTLAYDQLQLLTLEGERVAKSMVALLVFGLVAGLIALSLWFAGLAQILLLALHYGLSPLLALGLVMVIMLFGLWWALRRCAYYSRLLRFPATMQSLKPAIAKDTGENATHT